MMALRPVKVLVFNQTIPNPYTTHTAVDWDEDFY